MDSIEAAGRVDSLLAELACAYRALPRCEHLAAKFRSAMTVHALPGAYVAKGAAPRPLAELLREESQC